MFDFMISEREKRREKEIECRRNDESIISFIVMREASKLLIQLSFPLKSSYSKLMQLNNLLGRI